jgi:hypothetical protein
MSTARRDPVCPECATISTIKIDLVTAHARRTHLRPELRPVCCVSGYTSYRLCLVLRARACRRSKHAPSASSGFPGRLWVRGIKAM